ncbi:hypothetical protein MUN82_20970 [Hymenobacter aerilatus]|uniref:DUF3887 domain-containing protein n=1 Tax=Hymenobacter aerilatus TaxID=2932251 RepID=A0A8T9SU59_9BACT|nr:hypothetical protein [Hymenobacter aerilatus]UOR05385.1 hypothetical protein MUN82_20970 [Hymenobacter aerilatus]
MIYFTQQQRAAFFTFLFIVCGGLLLAAGLPPKKTSQVQLTRKFLLTVLQGKYRDAYPLLTSETRQHLTTAQFRTDSRVLYEHGKRFGPRITLYKLGFRFGDDQKAHPFYQFHFASDTLRPKPQVLLDVSFRDSTATQVMTFGLVPAPQKRK